MGRTAGERSLVRLRSLECRHLASPLPSPSMMDIGARSSRPTSSRPRGITLELTPMSFWRSQESMCTPTGQGRGATFQRRRTRPKKEMEVFLHLLLICLWHNSCACVVSQFLAQYLPQITPPGLPQCLDAICYISKRL